MTRPSDAWSAGWSGRVERGECVVPGETHAQTANAAEYSAAYARQSPPRANAQRLRQADIEAAAAAVTDRDRAVLSELQRVRVLSGGQLERLLFADISVSARDRVRRRVLARLHAWRLVTTLERRVGGERAGSTGLIYCLDSGGAWLLATTDQASPDIRARVRRPTTPGSRFLRHALSVSEIYVSLREVERLAEGRWQLTYFDAEPACWWPDGMGGQLKPDARTTVVDPNYQYSWWIEVDLGTESLPTVEHKLKRYSDFHLAGGLGPDGVMPRVLVTVVEERRRLDIAQMARALGTPDLFTTALLPRAVERLIADTT